MITTEQQKRLTEFLGECWHMPGIGHCHICDKLMAERLDFTDWRVVGRLIERWQEEAEPSDWSVYSRSITPMQTAISHRNPKRAICLAIDSYLKEREER